MSSHIFEEIEEVCDKVAMIKDGKLIDIADMYEMRHGKIKSYTITFKNESDLKKFSERFECDISTKALSCNAVIPSENIDKLLLALCNYDLKNMTEQKMTLAQHFMKTYKREEK